MNIEESVYKEFRSKFDAAFENNADLRLTIARIETTVAVAQERLYEKMTEIAKSLKEITLVSDALTDLRERMDRKRQEHEKLMQQAVQLQQEISTINIQINQIRDLKSQLKHERIVLYVTIAILIILACTIIIHVI